MRNIVSADTAEVIERVSVPTAYTLCTKMVIHVHQKAKHWFDTNAGMILTFKQECHLR